MSRTAVEDVAPLAAALLFVGALGGCDGGSRGAQGPEAAPDTLQGRLLVLAAASLTEAMGDAARAFEAEHPGTRVETSFAGSQALRLQVEHGVRADVFASANPAHTGALRRAGLVRPPEPLVDNELVVVTPAGRPLESLRQLTLAERIVLAGPEVPAGAYADRLLDQADAVFGAGFARTVRGRVVSREPNVRAVLSKVVL
ncbi:MAG TPA: molybdate ABC transporter substrate-binding protein, partial [Polyangiaceae bacterium LLY-WYZ-14_1]|nr:molybdate ABC transporter substrate-binding protein [Polyangiaceae bacterium LLY-WYZ-14_1]